MISPLSRRENAFGLDNRCRFLTTRVFGALLLPEVFGCVSFTQYLHGLDHGIFFRNIFCGVLGPKDMLSRNRDSRALDLHPIDTQIKQKDDLTTYGASGDGRGQSENRQRERQRQETEKERER